MLNESGEKKDRILLLFPNHLVILTQNLNSTFEFITKIPFLNSTNTQLNIQIKRVNNIEIIDSIYASSTNSSNLIESISGSKYCFELIIGNNSSRLLIICSSHFDIKMWIELISNQLSKLQFALNNKSLTPSQSSCSSASNTTSIATSITPNNNKTISREQMSPKSPTPNQQLTNSIKKVNQALKQQSAKSNSTSSSSTNLNVRKHFTMRPHPALIPHFQLPNDVPSNSMTNSLQVLAASNADLGQVKRFMYKKAKLSEPFGKCNN